MSATIALPPAVCILPMSDEVEFPNWSISDVQARFFLGATTEDAELSLLSPAHPGRYRYRANALAEGRAEPGTLVLFQFSNHIIASAVLYRIERYVDVKDGDKYRGAFWFVPESIRIFQPVGLTTLRSVWPEVATFGSVRHYVEPANYLRFNSLLRGVAAPILTYLVG